VREVLAELGATADPAATAAIVAGGADLGGVRTTLKSLRWTEAGSRSTM